MLTREKERFPLQSLRNEVERIFDDFFDGSSSPLLERRTFGPSLFTPALDMKETDANLVVEVELPGLEAKEVDVQVEDGTLVLRGERKQEKEEKTKQWHRSERYWGKFERRVALPEYADVEKIDATCKNGVLTVVVPKKAGVKPKAINVRVK
jgi:HSP20 family protein